MTRTGQTLAPMLAAACACLLFVSCSKEKQAAKTPEPASPAGYVDITLPDLPVGQPMLPEPTGLSRSDHEPVGSYLLPDRIVEVRPHDMPRDSKGVSRYDIEASLEEVMEFYQRRGYKVVRNPKGASVFPRSGDGILQILKRDGRKLRLLVIADTGGGTAAPKELENPNLD